MKIIQSCKPLLLTVVFGLTSLLLFFSGCGKEDVDFKRLPIPVAGKHGKDVLEKHRMELFQARGRNYAHAVSEGANFKGKLLVLNREKKQIDFKPNVKGKYTFRIQFLCFPAKGGRLITRINHNKKKLGEKIYRANGIYTREHDLDLSTGDTVSLILRGKAAVSMIHPMVYKKKTAEERVNVFIICADTLGAKHMSLYGYHRETDPNIKAFAKDSVVFKNAYAQAPWTLPSHMSLFTGLYEYHHGVKKQGVLSPQKDFLVEQLARTFHTRSINGGGWIKSMFGFYRGFDYYKSYGRCGARPNSAENLFNLAIEDIENQDLPRTFYFLHCYQVHAPYRPPMRFLKKINRKPKKTSMLIKKNWPGPDVPEAKVEAVRTAAIDLYDGEILTFDHYFGTFIQYLKKKNLYDNSMIIFLSDHGDEFYQHKNWGHDHALYDEITRIPLIVKFPKGKYKGKTVEQETGLIDVMPTILSYYHIEYDNKNIDGINLDDFIQGKAINRPLYSSITSGFYFPVSAFKVAMFKDRKKIIYNLPYKKAMASKFILSPMPFEYYDLQTDPDETTNLNKKHFSHIKSVFNQFKTIIKKGVAILNKTTGKAKIDQKTKDSLKSLGYL